MLCVKITYWSSISMNEKTIAGPGPGFSVGGGVDPFRGGFGLQCGHFSVKMYVKTKELGPVGGVHRHAPLDPPMNRQHCLAQCNSATSYCSLLCVLVSKPQLTIFPSELMIAINVSVLPNVSFENKILSFIRLKL